MKKVISILMSFCIVFLSYNIEFADNDTNVSIDKTTFPDPIFREYVSENYDTNEDGKLSTEELIEIKSVCVRNEAIASLMGLEQFVYLNSISNYTHNKYTITLPNGVNRWIYNYRGFDNTNEEERTFSPNSVVVLDEIESEIINEGDAPFSKSGINTYTKEKKFVFVENYPCFDEEYEYYEVANFQTIRPCDIFSSCPNDIVFLGWSSEPDGSGTEYLDQPGDKYAGGGWSPYSQTVYMYAQWGPLNSDGNEEKFGVCGDNAYWTYNDNTSTLEISGIGEMYNYNYALQEGIFVPWNMFKDEVENVIVNEGITSIGHWAFEDMIHLSSVNLPSSLLSIGYDAFQRCTLLDNVVIPSSVTTIFAGAFRGCDALKKIELNEGLKTIGPATFVSSGITSLKLPASLESIAESAVDNCPELESITVAQNNEQYSSIDGVLFNNNFTRLIVCPEAKRGEYYIPDTVTTIAESAFNNCRELQGVTIPKSVEEYEGIYDFSAFGSCWGLRYIAVDENNTVYKSIDGAMYSKDGTVLFSLPGTVIADTYVVPDGVEKIVSAVFCLQPITELILPSSLEYVGMIQTFDSEDLKTIYFKGNAPEIWIRHEHEDGRPYSLFSAETKTVIKCNCNSTGWDVDPWCNQTIVISHSNVMTDSLVAPTATTDGCTKGSHCEVCGSILIPQEVIPAYGTEVLDLDNVSIKSEDELTYIEIPNSRFCVDLDIRSYAFLNSSSFAYGLYDSEGRLIDVKVAALVPGKLQADGTYRYCVSDDSILEIDNISGLISTIKFFVFDDFGIPQGDNKTIERIEFFE